MNQRVHLYCYLPQRTSSPLSYLFNLFLYLCIPCNIQMPKAFGFILLGCLLLLSFAVKTSRAQCPWTEAGVLSWSSPSTWTPSPVPSMFYPLLSPPLPFPPFISMPPLNLSTFNVIFYPHSTWIICNNQEWAEGSL